MSYSYSETHTLLKIEPKGRTCIWGLPLAKFLPKNLRGFGALQSTWDL